MHCGHVCILGHPVCLCRSNVKQRRPCPFCPDARTDRSCTLPESISWAECVQETSRHHSQGPSGNFEFQACLGLLGKKQGNYLSFLHVLKGCGHVTPLAHRTHPLSKAASKLYSFSLGPTRQVSANMSAATKVTSDIPCAIGTRLLFVEVQ